MSIADKFQKFCSDLRMDSGTVATVSYRYHRITQQLNESFRSLSSENANSLYVGSYGRGTAIHVSDIDMLYILPGSDYLRFNGYSLNGQSAMLQEVRRSIAQTFPQTTLRGDGQVVVVEFSDGVRFEIVPCFLNDDDSFTYPDTNKGGHWKKTNPRPEIDAIRLMNAMTNKNLCRLCRMIRAWKDHCGVSMGGLLIDTLAHGFIRNWSYRDKSFMWYDWLTRDFFEYLSNINDKQSYWYAVGSNQLIYPQGNFSYKAKQAYNNALEAIEHEKSGHEWSANQKWREIYGYLFAN
jgi:hypothetical protein